MFAASNVVMPLPSLLDVDTEEFMREAETWPRTRVSILTQARWILQERFLRRGSRSIASLTDWFNDVREVASGYFGTVFTACIRKWSAEGEPLKDPTCVTVTVPTISARPHALRLVIKITKWDAGTRGCSPFAAHDVAYTHWEGSRNPVREASMGRLLNSLVVCGATPNLPLIYEPFSTWTVASSGSVAVARSSTRARSIPALRLPAFLVRSRPTSMTETTAVSAVVPSIPIPIPIQSPTRGFVMELCSIRFGDYLARLSAATPSAASARITVMHLDSAVLQICHGLLCAQKHFDFRHNDLHVDNVMATFITDTSYNYLIAKKVFPIQNYGMCWKVIDFGFAACAAFGERDVAEALLHSIAPLRVSRIGPCAVELLDLLYLLQSARAVSGDVVQARLDLYVDLLHEISVASERRYSLQAVLAGSQHDRFTITMPTAEMAADMRSSGLLERFFVALASRSDARAREISSGPVFDAESSPFSREKDAFIDVYDDIRIPGVPRAPYALYDVLYDYNDDVKDGSRPRKVRRKYASRRDTCQDVTPADSSPSVMVTPNVL